MKPQPTGRVVKGETGAYDLILTRTFPAPIADVWASITEPDRTARWFGTWRGTPGPGRTVEFQMGFEEGTPWGNLTIETCEPPRLLAVSAVDDEGAWHLELRLTEGSGVTTLEFVQHLTDPSVTTHSGPGWEYYLDMLVASRTGQPLPDFDDYYPAQAEYFAEQARAS